MSDDTRSRTLHLTRVRRSFTGKQKLARVGYVGLHQLHRINCRDFQEAERWPERGMEAVRMGNLDAVFDLLLDDYPTGDVEFPALHACLRS